MFWLVLCFDIIIRLNTYQLVFVQNEQNGDFPKAAFYPIPATADHTGVTEEQAAPRDVVVFCNNDYLGQVKAFVPWFFSS